VQLATATTSETSSMLRKPYSARYGVENALKMLIYWV
jgi:hypothetical protein